jgi:23S rRNA pseudouridine2605 synthase
MPKKSRKNPELKATESLELIPIESPEPKLAENPEPKVRKRAARKAPAVPDSVPAQAPKQEPDEPELYAHPAGAGPDQVAEARTQAESEAKASAADTFEQAFDDTQPPLPELVSAHTDEPSPEPATTKEDEAGAPEISLTVDDADEEAGFSPEPRPPAKLERLQKILSQAGIASRRHAEEMITEGRVQVNGKVITELGSKADASRDHIRVDGKLLQGAERLRYFMLNKPRGYVTTVSDPEGRPTVIQIFSKMSERLYPVGRLDYLSEGLLLVTNDGDLANKLTKAATGVEKTYLVKVSGQPSEEELDRLREGVGIDRTRPGEGRVRTAPASIRQVRQGDNPWYEVVLIEGRNRELRKMFEEIGHFVEKIRRVGYGPLVLDQEPGQFRELEPEELVRLRQAAEGKWRRPKSKMAGRRDVAERGELPTVAPKPGRPRPATPFEGRTPSVAATRPYPPKKPSGPSDDREQSRPFRPSRTPGKEFGPAGGHADAAGKTFSTRKPAAGGFVPRMADARARGPAKFGPGRPAWKKEDRGARPPASFTSTEGNRDRSAGYRGGQTASRPAPGGQGSSDAARAGTGRIGAARTFGPKPAWNKREGGDRPRFDRGGSGTKGGLSTRASNRPGFETPRPASPRPVQFRPTDSQGDRPRFERTGGTRPAQAFGRTGPRPTSPVRPPREGMARPFTTSTGKPRAGGARPSSKPGKPTGRPYGGSRQGTEGTSGARPAGKSGWKPKPNYGGTSRPASGGGKRPPSKSAPRGAGGRSGPRPGAKRPGGGGGQRY